MNCTISSIHYCPVKSVSFQNIKSCKITKNLGMINDRIFAFSRGIDLEKAKLFEKMPNERKLNNLLTLKNSPVLNKYNFIYENNKLTLTKDDKDLITVSSDDPNERMLLSSKLMELEKSLIQPIFLLKNINFPFYDTSSSNKVFNSMSLINLNSIKDFENLSNHQVEHERFRGNIYVEDLDKWEERKLVGKVLSISDIKFKVIKEIPRCSATNIKPKTSDINLNIPLNLKKIYNHINLGIYLDPLNDGKINKGDLIKINE